MKYTVQVTRNGNTRSLTAWISKAKRLKIGDRIKAEHAFYSDFAMATYNLHPEDTLEVIG